MAQIPPQIPNINLVGALNHSCHLMQSEIYHLEVSMQGISRKDNKILLSTDNTNIQDLLTYELFGKIVIFRYWEMAPCVKCLLGKHEDLSLGPQNPCKA